MNRLEFDAATPPTTTGRTLTFLANSGTRMVNGLTVDLETLRVPLSDGTTKLAADITTDDHITVPLLLDHVPSVEAQAGAVTNVWMNDAGLMATATLSRVEAGETVRQLAVDGVLTNSFSITIDYAEQPGKDGIIHDAELVEISVVYRGADSKAAFRSLNSRGETTMANHTVNMDAINKTVASFKLTADEASALNDAIRAALQDALDEITDDIKDVSEGESSSGDDNPAPEPPQQTANAKEPHNTMSNTIIVNKAGRANQNATMTATRATWLDSPEAFAAFERNLFQHDNMGVENTVNAWNALAREKMGETASFGIAPADVDKFIPTEAITAITDALNTRGSGLWNMFQKTGLDRLTVGANIGGLTDATRAHGYPVKSYGTPKAEQVVTFVKRALEADYTYKYIRLNKGDIRRTQRPGVLLRYILSELPNYIIQTIERQAVLGGYEDMAHFRPITTDMDDTASEWAGNRFALKVEHGTSGVLLYDFYRAAAKITAPGAKVLVTSADMLTDLLLSQDAEGRTLIDLGSAGVAARLGVSQIITPEWWTAADADKALGVVFAPSNYAVVGDTSIEAFTNFSLQTNTNEFLQEIYAGGGLSREKSAAVVVPTKGASGK